MAGVAARYASRSVARNLRRTALSVVGIAIGCVLALSMESLNRGKARIFADAGASSGVGHFRVVPAEWPERRDARLRLANPNAALSIVRARPEVKRVAPRVRAQVLLAMGTHVVAEELVGVDPAIEPAVFRYVRTVQQGRYLRAGERGTLVVGRAVADRLTAGVDDDVVVSAVGPRGEIQSLLLRIVGIVATGSDDSDYAVCQAAIDDVAEVSGLPGIGELAIVLNDYSRVDEVAHAVRSKLAGGDRVLTFVEIVPEIDGHLKQDAASSRFISYLILFIVLLGVASAQLAAVLERRREFAVLAALGMTGATMVRLVLQEAVILGLAGALAGTVAGAPLIWAFARRGIDLSGWLGGSYSFQGVFIEPVLYGDFGAWIVSYVFAVAIGATVIASLYPAWFAARTDPAAALRVAQ